MAGALPRKWRNTGGRAADTAAAAVQDVDDD
jgi:hypothetical protein